MKSRPDAEDRKMLSDLSAWMAERVFAAQQIHFETSNTTIKQYTSAWNSKLKELKQKLASILSGPVVLMDHRKELLASLEEGAFSQGQVEAGRPMGL